MLIEFENKMRVRETTKKNSTKETKRDGTEILNGEVKERLRVREKEREAGEKPHTI